MNSSADKPLAGIAVAVLTLSDKGSQGRREDKSGPAVREMAEKAGGTVTRCELLPDESGQIQQQLRRWCGSGQGIDLILTTGGTGFSRRDVPPAATLAVIERGVPGISERMRAAGYAHNHRAILSRGVSGICGGTLIVNLPGSVRGACESLESVLDVLGHGIQILKNEAGECGS
jgi:molybdopterin adenylyltransferase